MSAQVSAPVRLMVIVSGDYGELGSALYFLQGLGPSFAPTLLLPASLGHALASAPHLQVARYDGLADIEEQLMALRPAAVLLFSGYLLALGRRFSLLNSLRLLRRLRRLGVPVLTSDPFIGLISGPAALDFSCVLAPSGSALGRWFRSRQLSLRLVLLRRQLGDCWHIYPSPVGRSRELRQRPRALGYFNACEEPGAQVAAQRQPRDPNASWIFVLSQIDWQIQARMAGSGFVESLVGRLCEAVAFGRRAVLVAPAALLEAVRASVGDRADMVLLHSESYPDFMKRLMEAEYAFFWNYYSFSVIHRVLRKRPVMFFDEGHMVRIVPALHEAGIRLFYDGWRPPVLGMSASLDLGDLRQRAAQAEIEFCRISEGLGQCDAPRTVLLRALSAEPRDVVDAQA